MINIQKTNSNSRNTTTNRNNKTLEYESNMILPDDSNTDRNESDYFRINRESI